MFLKLHFLLMRKYSVLLSICLCLVIFCSMTMRNASKEYADFYNNKLNTLHKAQEDLIDYIQNTNELSADNINNIKKQIWDARIKMKSLDFWLRYLEPVAYMKINGPLPVEWENEVFEKYEKPYRRTGAGLSLAEICLDEPTISKDSLLNLLQQSEDALATFRSDSITKFFKTPDHFFFANRLYLLNLAAIYTTGFECPDSLHVIPELAYMLKEVENIYTAFETSFPGDSLTQDYLNLYESMEAFVSKAGATPSAFDHFHFIKDYVNPLFGLNQQLIHRYHVISKNYNDYSLNNNCYSIFNKSLYRGQNEKGIFLPVDDTNALHEIRETGKLLFYDPILSGNGKRSCAGCHKPTEFFTDTAFATALQFESGGQRLKRNTPSLVNAIYNHLLMLDGKHYTLQNQAKDVISNAGEMGGSADDVVNNIMSCIVYRKAFQRYVKLTPNYPEVSLDHIVSAITLYFSSFSRFNAPFDDAMNTKQPLNTDAIKGFNLFMSKAVCATCHFLPVFNGVKPPYVSSEFEVLGVPADSSYHAMSADSGRFYINPAPQTMSAFRTGTIRNSTYTKPYMHNGVFKTIDEVIDFYDTGGGAGHHLNDENQTLPADSLHLSVTEKNQLKAFLRSLDENVVIDSPPSSLPVSKIEKFKNRVQGGVY